MIIKTRQVARRQLAFFSFFNHNHYIKSDFIANFAENK